ncbi:heavy-metal-associated domain-containing protein [Flavobacterium sp.]|uniref:heavy-metal-associated domain-containing protein n=1 Tax=Flavobacterium sp. TaxID=239 RepID=UPI0039E6CB6F
MNFTKSLLAMAVCGVFFVSCKQTDSAPKEETAVASTQSNAPAKMETASFNIDGMSCAIGCAKTIEKKLAEMDGVEKAEVDFEKKTATVEFDANKQTPETLVKTVEAAADGKTYKVSNVNTSGNHAALYVQDQEKEKKADKKKAKKTESCATESNGAKPACCSAKKHCSADEKKA